MLERWLWLAAVVIGLDQASKLVVSSHVAYGETLAVAPFFNLVRVHNTGAAFSFLSEAGGVQRWLLSAVAIVASLWIVWLLHRHRAERLFSLALALILGGALGNLIDRIAYGHVVDFLDFYWGIHHFPAFNIADSAITVGASLLVWEGVWRKRHGNPAG